MTSSRWREAWHDALYGPRGFYRRAEGPAGHFTTSTHGSFGAVFADAVARLADREGASRVVDVGAGRGELLGHLRAIRPGLGLTGVDVVSRPGGIPDDVTWLVSPGGSALASELNDVLAQPGPALVVAQEWLDVIPCTVAEVVRPGLLAEVLVEPATGTESLGDPLSAEDLSWCERHWPVDRTAVGERVEVGLARDRAWSGLLSRMVHGTAVAVDYGHTRGRRPAHGTLAGYRGGRLVDPVPDGSCDLTAHVAVDSLEHDQLTTQRAALHELGMTGTPPPVELARTDPAGYLAALARSSAVAALTDPGGLGGFRWVLRRVIR
ncbi:MAG: SAM-dependent methyltransferase [Dermatophilaceae bacterium]